MHSLCYVITALFASSVLAHVQMQDPPPIRSPKDPNKSNENVDYDYASPLNPDGSNYPCKGYQKDTPIRTVANYHAGETYNLTLFGSATHLGGSCQVSLSYDNGATFKVIKSMIGGCPLKDSYAFTIPPSAPRGNALLSWSWLNDEGNREFYMNCAWVAIDGSPGGSLDSLPNIWVANIKGVTTCTTQEREDPVFPRPGPDVEYGGGKSNSSPNTPGKCEAGSSSGSSSDSSSTRPSGSSPPGLFFEASVPAADPPIQDSNHVDHGFMDDEAIAPNPQPATQDPPLALRPLVAQPLIFAEVSTSVVMSETSTLSRTSSSSPFAYTNDPVYTPPSYTTITLEEDCAASHTTIATVEEDCNPLPDVTVTITAATVTIAPRSTSSTLHILCSPGWYLTSISQSPVCRPSTTMSGSPSPPKTSTILPLASTTPIVQPPNTLQTSTSPSILPSDTTPPYAKDTSLYLPCVPGKFLCPTRDTFLTCAPAGNSWTWLYPRAVADGMECLPFLSPMSPSGGSSSYGQEPGAPAGYYRDDRYVRYRPYGACSVNGSLQCVNGGMGFHVCDDGGWVDMGSAADGTTCVNGRIVAA